MPEHFEIMQGNQLDALARLVANGGVTVLAGAGLSTASGLPDFRGRAGLWTDGDLAELLTAEGAENNFEGFTKFCKAALAVVTAHHHNQGHEVIARWGRAGLVEAVITQNVDGYDHEVGGNAIEVHGTLRKITCTTCGLGATVSGYLAVGGEHCSCGGRRRPAIVLFGEALPPGVMRAMLEAAARTRLLLVIGTTLGVAPVTLLAPLVAANGGRIAILNDEPTQHDDLADFTVAGDLVENLLALEQALRRSSG